MKKIQMWQFISYEKKMELKSEYKIKPSNKVEVSNNKIVRDGITEEDLQEIPTKVLEEACPVRIQEKIEKPKEEEVKDEKEEDKKGGKKLF